MAELQEVVVVDAVRSAIGKSGRKGMEKGGQLCQASAQDLLASVMRGLLDRVKDKAPDFDEKEIEDVVVGCLSQIGEQGSNIARIASLLAGIPQEASAYTVNQYCNAGLKGINSATRAIKCGDGDIYLCAGVELMSHYGMGSDIQVAMEAKYPIRFTSRIDDTGMAVPQGVCAEMISAEHGHTREDLDRFGMWSMQKSVEARRKGWHDELIVPVEFEWEGKKYLAEKDETIRDKAVDDPDSYWEDLQKLNSPFKPEGGMVTAGNSSQIVDGAAAVLLMNAKKAEKLGIEPMCRISACASAGGEPVPMLLAPIPACQKAMKRAGKKIDDFDIIEPNEAFASPLLVFGKELGYDNHDPRVNPTGGAIGMGHPIGASGVIWFSEMVHHLKRINGRAGMMMMCGGGGIGISTIVERV
jgi:acetyl-CoA acetyltransferase family protein